MSIVDELRGEQSGLKAEKQRLSKELRNAEKRRLRLKQRAKELSTEDLLSVLYMRQQEADKRARKLEASKGKEATGEIDAHPDAACSGS